LHAIIIVVAVDSTHDEFENMIVGEGTTTVLFLINKTMDGWLNEWVNEWMNERIDPCLDMIAGDTELVIWKIRIFERVLFSCLWYRRSWLTHWHWLMIDRSINWLIDYWSPSAASENFASGQMHLNNKTSTKVIWQQAESLSFCSSAGSRNLQLRVLAVRLFHCQVTSLGKLFTKPLSPSSIIWYRPNPREGNGSMWERYNWVVFAAHCRLKAS